MRALRAFFFTPAYPHRIALLRIGIASALLYQALSLSSSYLEFYASDGLLQGSLKNYLSPGYLPTIARVSERLALPFRETGILQLIGLGYLSALCFMLAGFCTRLSTGLCWLLHWLLMTSSYGSSYGFDQVCHVFLFYLAWMPAGHALSVDAWLGRSSCLHSSVAGFSTRILQLHLCLIYLASGLEKAKGPQWQTGEVIWRSLMLPIYRQYDFSWMASYPLLSLGLAWSTLAVEIGYAVFIWPRQTRKLWVTAAVCLHLGVALFLGLTLFSWAMVALNLALFAVSSFPRRRFTSLPLTLPPLSSRPLAPRS